MLGGLNAPSLPPPPQGLTRVRNSSDVVGALLKELRLQAGRPLEEGQGVLRLAVAVDSVNALWGCTSLKKEDKSGVSCTPVMSLLCLYTSSWPKAVQFAFAMCSNLYFSQRKNT